MYVHIVYSRCLKQIANFCLHPAAEIFIEEVPGTVGTCVTSIACVWKGLRVAKVDEDEMKVI
jgi:hypothetical protein